jgi:hypothetical protein
MLDTAFDVGGAIGLLAGRVTAVEKPLAMFGEHFRDAFGFDEIDAVADYRHISILQAMLPARKNEL